ncbi:MAG: ABC transporter ATP-binding protein [Alphaproteobacteria bacterium]|nr:ABC transporter ATP-binding protein [Alphaproteobacteria bacterium]
MSEIALQLENVTRHFKQAGETLEVLRGANLTLKRGEVVALVGPSGSGKTTLLQITGLLDKPTSGQVVLAGKPVDSGSDKLRTARRLQDLGFVYQFHHLLPEFSAVENVILPQMIKGVTKQAAHGKAEELLTALGLGHRLTHRPSQLSGGEQQRVAIARALANDPAVVLADEPTGNLDPHKADEVFDLFLRIAKERNVAALIATHNMELAGRMDRIVRMQDGILA